MRGNRRQRAAGGREWAEPLSPQSSVLSPQSFDPQRGGSPLMWRCNVCGYTTQDAQQPTICPVCGSEDSFAAFTPPSAAADPRSQRHTRYASVGVPQTQQAVRPSYIEKPNWATVGLTDSATRERGYEDTGGIVPPSPTPKTGAQDFTLGV